MLLVTVLFASKINNWYTWIWHKHQQTVLGMTFLIQNVSDASILGRSYRRTRGTTWSYWRNLSCILVAGCLFQVTIYCMVLLGFNPMSPAWPQCLHTITVAAWVFLSFVSTDVAEIAAELKARFQTVHPVCHDCRENSFKERTRGEKKLKKWKDELHVWKCLKGF